MYTIEDIQKRCEYLSSLVGDTFDCPVRINGRLTRTLGRFCYKYVNGECVQDVLEMSKQLLETATEESVISVIDHEWCHYYATKSTGEHHGHDAYFKEICGRVGCTNDKTRTSVDRIVSASSIYKYQVFCPTCEEFISGYSRMSKTLKNIDECYCKKCGQYGLEVIQNW